MIVLAPAGDIGPGDRRILAAGDLKRQFKIGIWQVTDGWRRTRLFLRDANDARQTASSGAIDNADSDHAKRAAYRKASRA